LSHTESGTYSRRGKLAVVTVSSPSAFTQMGRLSGYGTIHITMETRHGAEV